MSFRNKFTLVNIILFFVVNFTVVGQKAKTHVLSTDEAKMVKKDAATTFGSADYKGALPQYQDLYKTDPQNVDYNYKLGFCYLMTTVDKKAALKHLSFACASKEAKKEWQYYLGLANMYNEKWDDATKAFNEYKDATHSKVIKDFLPVERMIEMSANGKELSAKPVNCIFKNMGKVVNTIYEEFNPFISADNRTLVFTTRRKGNVGGFIEDLGIYTADIYWAVWKDTIWSKAKALTTAVNTEWDEESVSLSPNGDQVYIYFDNVDVYGDIGVSSLKGKMWQKPVMLQPEVNSKQMEGSACSSLDGNEIYFSSDRKEGQGLNDIWMVKKINGQWQQAVNLGNTINTAYDDVNPFLSTDGKKLYFSSRGWNSMGGYDIFCSTRNDKDGKWEKPVNIGFPLNDADDNMFISFTGDERFACLSALRPEGMGESDIYQIEFPDTSHHKFKHVVKGIVTTVSGRIEITKVALTNKATSESMEFIPGTSSTQFVFAADPGDYTLKIEGYNFAPYTEDVSVGNDFPPVEINKTIQLKPAK